MILERRVRTPLPPPSTGSSSTHTEPSSTIEKRAERTTGAGLRGLAWPPPRRGARPIAACLLALCLSGHFLIFDFEDRVG